MHTKIPFLVVFFLSIVQVLVYTVLSYEEFDEVLTVKSKDIEEITIIDYSDQEHSIKNPEQIETILAYLDQFEYQRLLNDETAYMPMHTMTIRVYDGDQEDFIIPYGDEVLISHKVYQIRNGPIEEEVLLELFNLEKK